jgi:hypothetical protein
MLLIAYLNNRMIEFCKTKIAPEIIESLEPFKHDDELVRKYGI